MSQAYDPATLDFYAAEAPVYAASGPGGASARLHGFLDRLAPGALILELGCGGGRDAAAMLAAGFDVDATDGSPAMAAKAEARIGRPVRVMRFDQLDAVAAYDAIWAHASLLHVPFDALPGVLTRIRRALRAGGWHFASFKAGGYAGEAENGSGGRARRAGSLFQLSERRRAVGCVSLGWRLAVARNRRTYGRRIRRRRRAVDIADRATPLRPPNPKRASIDDRVDQRFVARHVSADHQHREAMDQRP